MYPLKHESNISIGAKISRVQDNDNVVLKTVILGVDMRGSVEVYCPPHNWLRLLDEVGGS